MKIKLIDFFVVLLLSLTFNSCYDDTEIKNQVNSLEKIVAELGEHGITPEIKIENGDWYISVDNGATWTNMGNASGIDGKDGDSFFQEVSQDDHNVYLILSDGTDITIPKKRPLIITFNEADDISITPGATKTLSYTITGATEKTVVKSVAQNGWSAKITPDDYKSGKLSVTAPNPLIEDEILILVYDGASTTIMSSINFITGTITVATRAFSLPAEGVTVSVNIDTDIEYSIEIPEDAESWLSISGITTRSAMRYEAITFNLASNSDQTRYATVPIINNKGVVLETIAFEQAGEISSFSDTIRVLAIGNSFSVDAVENYLYDLGKADEVVFIIGNIYIGGSTLEMHWDAVSTNSTAYIYSKINAEGIKTTANDIKLIEGITDEPWDYITFQQASKDSGIFSTFSPYLTNLVNFVKENTLHNNVRFAWHSTWAYAQNSTHPRFANYNNNQITMYEAIVDASIKATTEQGFEVMIPAGTAIQNGRTSFLGDTFCRDGYHLDYVIGRYTAACVWYQQLTGNSVIGNSYKPASLVSVNAEIAQKAAHSAVLSPHSVTDMSGEYPEIDGEYNNATAEGRLNLINDSYFVNTGFDPTEGPNLTLAEKGYWYPRLSGAGQQMFSIINDNSFRDRKVANMKALSGGTWHNGLAQRISAPDNGIYRVGFWGKYNSGDRPYVRIFLRINSTGEKFFCRANSNITSMDQFLSTSWVYYTVDFDLSRINIKNEISASTTEDLRDFSLYFSNFSGSKEGDILISGVTMTKLDNTDTPSGWYNPGFEESYAIPYLLTSNGEAASAQENTTKGIWVLSLPKGINDVNNNATIVVDTTEYYSGQRSMKLNVASVEEFSNVYLASTLFNIPKGDYTLSFWAKTDIDNVPFRIDIDNYNTELNGAKYGFPFNDNAGIMEYSTASSSWRKYEVSFNNSAMSDTLSIAIRPNIGPDGTPGIWKNNEATYWFDDFIIE